jgi:two-component system, sensor histidine kinase and response regulator
MSESKPVTILHVDDDEPGRYARTRVLKLAGFQVDEAGSGSAALTLAGQLQPDLLVLDVNLPGVNGLEVARRLKSDPLTARIPILQITSAARDSKNLIAGLEAGADAYLTEPVEPEVLVATVRALARIRRMTDELEATRAALGEQLRRVQDLNAELELRVEERTAELRANNAELKQFAYLTSHDLQEPLRAVAGFTQLLARRYQEKLDEDAREYTEFILDGVNRMSALIDDLLAYSRVGAADSSHFRNVSIEEVITRALRNLQMAVDEADAQVSWGELPEVYADSKLLVQLFQNLIGNALKYRSERRPCIHISSAEVGPDYVISVEDNGIGIDPAYADLVFGIFKRLHGHEYPGTGVGLAICRKIVERHQGKIWVESRAAGGSIFKFSIPRDPLAAKAEEDVQSLAG